MLSTFILWSLAKTRAINNAMSPEASPSRSFRTTHKIPIRFYTIQEGASKLSRDVFNPTHFQL